MQAENQAPVQSKYSQVVGRVFQFSAGIPAEFSDVESRIVLRFLPSFDLPESQVVVLKKANGTIRVIQHRLRQGTRPISEQCNEILDRNPEASVDDILRQIAVEKVERLASDSTVRLMDEFSHLSIPAKLSPALTMDGTTYELWIQTPSNEIHAVFSDGAYGERTNSVPIIRWVKAVQAEVAKQK